MYLPYTGLAHPQQQVAPFGVGMQAQCICVFTHMYMCFTHIGWLYAVAALGL